VRYVGTMGLAMAFIVLIFVVPLGGYVWWVAIAKPQRGREMQDKVWRPLAQQLGGSWTASKGGARFHAMAVPRGGTLVTALVFDRAAVDAEVKSEAGGVEVGGWRTFVQANVVGRGPAFEVTPGATGKGLRVGDAQLFANHHVRALLRTPPEAIAPKLTAEVCAAINGLGERYTRLVVGPQFVSLELPGVCADAGAITAAIDAVGGIAGASAYPPPPPSPNPGYPPPPAS
jgi:hypothetical protein